MASRPGYVGHMFRVVQYSDLHFSTSGELSHGGFGYDTDETWNAIFEHSFGPGGTATGADLAVCTGDIADHGWADEYLLAQQHLSRVPIPVAVVPGNHDYHAPFEARLPTPGISMQRTHRIGPWLFILADSNRSGREEDGDGRLIDTDQRIEGIGELGAREIAWIDEMIAQTDAEHVFIWVHHPPAMTGAVANYMSSAFHDDFAALVSRQPKIRGLAAGHVHTDVVGDLGGIPVFVCPAFTINLDFEAGTLLPPGYRTFSFEDDGTITSECHLLDDDRWPRHRLPDPALRYLAGDATIAEVKEALGIPTDAPSPI